MMHRESPVFYTYFKQSPAASDAFTRPNTAPMAFTQSETESDKTDTSVCYLANWLEADVT